MEKKQEALILLEEVHTLLQLNGENVFKIRAYEKAIGVLEGAKDFEQRLKAKTLAELPGIGKGISELLYEWNKTGVSKEKEELARKVPPGLLELTRIPGLGPKKAKQVIDELGVNSMGELEYAISENRLMHLKGFGEKVQKKISEGIEFLKSTQGQLLLSEALVVAEKCESLIKVEIQKKKITAEVFRSGALRRHFEVLSSLDFVVKAQGLQEKVSQELKSSLHQKCKELLTKQNCSLNCNISILSSEDFGLAWLKATGSDAHVAIIEKKLKTSKNTGAFLQEDDVYRALGLKYVAPELRETGMELDSDVQSLLDQLVTEKSVQGVFHNHSTYSDGRASLEDMIARSQELGYKYIGISDHSQSAFYARGLKVENLKAQRKEVDQLQKKYSGIKIFWGVESDILQDGSLDYDSKTLKLFDFVVASIHSRFQMGKAEMTDRILKAIRNPATRFLGHSTGRLLLGRKPYEIDMPKIISEAKKHDVAIEINANPQRLDIDWRWGSELRKHQCLVSINPDAHDLEGLEHTKFGVTVARKGLIPQSLIINTRSAKEVSRWLARA